MPKISFIEKHLSEHLKVSHVSQSGKISKCFFFFIPAFLPQSYAQLAH